MDPRKILVTRVVKGGDIQFECDRLEGERMRRLLSNSDVAAIVMLSDGVEFTVHQYHYMERMFRVILKEPVSVVY